MEIDIYRSTKISKKYLSVPSGTDVASINLPESVEKDLLPLKIFKGKVHLDPSKGRIALDQEQIIKDIETNGYAIHAAEIKVSISH